MNIEGRWYIYHEKQISSLCAVHCLNALLQGRYFDEMDLATIAKELDEKERLAMLENGGESKDFLRFMAQDSENVGDDGNYSIQVIVKALEVWSLVPVSMRIKSPEMEQIQKDPTTQTAYLCNLAKHWFTIRKIGKEWYNLNSLFNAPEHLSEFYLSLFLDSLKQKGYDIFVIKGDLPGVESNRSNLSKEWKPAHSEGHRLGTREPTKPQDEDEQLRQALEESEFEAALQLSLQTESAKSPSSTSTNTTMGVSISTPAQHGSNSAITEQNTSLNVVKIQKQENELELQKAKPEPPAAVGVTTTLMLRFPGNKRVARRFLKHDTLQEVVLFCSECAQKPPQDVQIMVPFPKRVFSNMDATIQQEGIEESALDVSFSK